MFFSVYTLGCKLNQLETEAITDSFCRAGFTFLPWGHVPGEHEPAEPSLLIINTCTVTSMAEQKARRVIRKALREHPAACLIVTGCYAQMERAALAELDGALTQRLFIVPGEKKDRILDLPGFIGNWFPGNGLCGEAISASLPGLIASWLTSPESCSSTDGTFRFVPEKFASHSRAFLKIQDGCNSCCAYCRVRIARGKSRSLPAGEALKALKSLEERGVAEAVLTGVNISQYRNGGMGLFELLDFLLKGTEMIRLRLSSLEPDLFLTKRKDRAFFHSGEYRVLSNHRLRPHFHLSLQSGSARILSAMARSYTPDDVENIVSFLRSAREDPFLACDVITGFPGETEEEFSKTGELCERIGFAWIHAFPFSPRPDTAACNFPNKVSEKDAVKRVEQLTRYARKSRRDYIKRWEGKEVEAVVEAGEGNSKDFVPAISENYLKLHITRGNACGTGTVPGAGALVRCRLFMMKLRQTLLMALMPGRN